MYLYTKHSLIACCPYLQTWNVRLRNAVFEVLHGMCRDTNVSFLLLCLAWLFDLVSLLMLPLGPSASAANPWKGGPIMEGVWGILGPVWLAPGAGELLHPPSVLPLHPAYL